MLLRYGVFFFFNDTATTEIYTLSLHDALPILLRRGGMSSWPVSRTTSSSICRVTRSASCSYPCRKSHRGLSGRSEEHTSELQSRQYLVCRLLLEKKKKITNNHPFT